MQEIVKIAMKKNMVIHVKNFKSLQDVSLEVGDINILVGANGSGKTNVLELFKFISMCVDPGRTPAYPFAPWWGFKNIVWSQNEQLPISIHIKYNLNKFKIEYSAAIQGTGDALVFREEELHISKYLHVKRNLKSAEYSLDEEFKNAYNSTIEEFVNYYESKTNAVLNDRAIVKMSTATSILDTLYRLVEFSEEFEAIELFLPDSDVTDLIIPALWVTNEDNERSLLYMDSLALFEHNLTDSTSQGIILLKNLNYDALHQPVQIDMTRSLQENGDGLINVLFQWHLKRQMPRRIERALENLFPGWSINFDTTPDGRILMQVNDGFNTLNPPSIPDGFYKMLAILVAVETSPKFLLIDELETSLHAKIIEYVLGELATCDAVVMATTHSPAVVDLTSLENIVLLDTCNGKTTCKRIMNPSKMTQTLYEKGLTHSEQWLYGKI